MTLIFVVCDMLKKKERKGKACCVVVDCIVDNCVVPHCDFVVIVVFNYLLLYLLLFSIACYGSVLCKFIIMGFLIGHSKTREYRKLLC